VSLKGAGKKKFKPSFTHEELFDAYTRFEKTRIGKAEKQLNRTGLKADPFAKFIVERTDVCPHKLISSTSSYWMDTVMLLDGEMGLTLPLPLEEIPAIFFDCLGVVRSMRSKVRKEETK
jgi:hypothetical protein